MEMVNKFGKMAEYMKESTLTILDMALEFVLGPMEVDMKVNG